MLYSEKLQGEVMNDKSKHERLKRKTYDDVIEDAYWDYVFDYGVHGIECNHKGEFLPSSTPNRNPEQVADVLWQNLLYKHLHKHFYN